MLKTFTMIFCFALAIVAIPVLSTNASAQVNVKKPEKPAAAVSGTTNGGSTTQNRDEKSKSSEHTFENCCTRMYNGGPGESGQWSKAEDGGMRCDGTPGPLICPPPLDGDLTTNTGGNTPKATSPNTKVVKMESSATTTTSSASSTTKGSGVSTTKNLKNVEFDSVGGTEKTPAPTKQSTPKVTTKKNP